MRMHTRLAQSNHSEENEWKVQVDILDDYIAYQD